MVWDYCVDRWGGVLLNGDHAGVWMESLSFYTSGDGYGSLSLCKDVGDTIGVVFR